MGLTIGIDIGGTKIAGGVVDGSGKILQSERRSTPSRGFDEVVAVVTAVVRELHEAHPEVEAVGVGAAGFVDASRARVLLAPNLNWEDEPLKDVVESATGLPVVVENDANAAAWGEYRFGAGQGIHDLVCVTVGTGIGGGLVSGGAIQRGAHGIAAEFGHLTVEMGGRPCACGNRGCWEQYASGNALVREARMLAGEDRKAATTLLDLGDGTPEGVQGKHITIAARNGDPVALAAFDSLARWLGIGMANVTTLLDPGAFVVGGGVSEAGDLLLNGVRKYLEEFVSGADNRVLPKVKPAAMGNAAGVAGAADLARQ